MSCTDAYLGTFVVARRGTYSSYIVTIYRQTCYVYHSTTYTFVRFAITSYAESQRFSTEMVGIKGTDAITILHTGKVYQIDKSVNLIKLFALQHTTNKSLARRTIARRILATKFVDAAGSLYGGHLRDAIGGVAQAVVIQFAVDFFPQRSAVWGVGQRDADGRACKCGANGSYLL